MIVLNGVAKTGLSRVADSDTIAALHVTQRNSHVPLFHKLNTPTIADINKLQTALFMHDYPHNNLPQNFTNYFKTYKQIHTHTHNTRQAK